MGVNTSAQSRDREGADASRCERHWSAPLELWGGPPGPRRAPWPGLFSSEKCGKPARGPAAAQGGRPTKNYRALAVGAAALALGLTAFGAANSPVADAAMKGNK